MWVGGLDDNLTEGPGSTQREQTNATQARGEQRVESSEAPRAVERSELTIGGGCASVGPCVQSCCSSCSSMPDQSVSARMQTIARTTEWSR